MQFVTEDLVRQSSLLFLPCWELLSWMRLYLGPSVPIEISIWIWSLSFLQDSGYCVSDVKPTLRLCPIMFALSTHWIWFANIFFSSFTNLWDCLDLPLWEIVCSFLLWFWYQSNARLIKSTIWSCPYLYLQPSSWWAGVGTDLKGATGCCGGRSSVIKSLSVRHWHI